jgi:ABC-type Zn2+ transport system substrate-binding protein/surface adhesin
MSMDMIMTMNLNTNRYRIREYKQEHEHEHKPEHEREQGHEHEYEHDMCERNLFYLEYRIALILGYPNIRIELNVDILSNRISGKETLSNTSNFFDIGL